MGAKNDFVPIFAWLCALESSKIFLLRILAHGLKCYTPSVAGSFLNILQRHNHKFQPRMIVRTENKYFHIWKMPQSAVMHVN